MLWSAPPRYCFLRCNTLHRSAVETFCGWAGILVISHSRTSIFQTPDGVQLRRGKYLSLWWRVRPLCWTESYKILEIATCRLSRSKIACTCRRSKEWVDRYRRACNKRPCLESVHIDTLSWRWVQCTALLILFVTTCVFSLDYSCNLGHSSAYSL